MVLKTGLVLFSLFLPAVSLASPFISRGGEDCSYGLSEVLKSPALNKNHIDSVLDLAELQEEHAKAIKCMDDCYSTDDASFLARNCVDWDQVLQFVRKKMSSGSILEFLFQNNATKCSAEDIARFQSERKLSGYYYDQVTKSCESIEYFDKKQKTSAFSTHTYNLLNFGILQYAGIVNDDGKIKGTGAPLSVRLEDNGLHQTKEALFTWSFKAVAAINFTGQSSVNSDALFESIFHLKGSVYKTFGRKNCKIILGASAQGNGHVFASFDGLENKSYTDPKILETALKAGFGVNCTMNENGDTTVYQIEIQGDLVRIGLFKDVFPKQGIDYAYNHAGKQVNITGSISPYVHSKTKPYFSGSIGVGNYTFPNQNFNIIESHLEVSAGAEVGSKPTGRFGGEAKVIDMYVNAPNGQSKNILGLYIGCVAGGAW